MTAEPTTDGFARIPVATDFSPTSGGAKPSVAKAPGESTPQMPRSCLMPAFSWILKVLVSYRVSAWHRGCSQTVSRASLGWVGWRNWSEEGGCHESNDAVDRDGQFEAGARALLRPVRRVEA